MTFAYLRVAPLALLLACGPDDNNDTTADGGTTGSGEMTCAELPAGKVVLDASIDPAEPPLTIAVTEWIDMSCNLRSWSGTLRLPEDITPGTYDLTEQPPSLFVDEEAVGSCAERQTAGVSQFTLGTVQILSITDDCIVVELNGDREPTEGTLASYRGVFALDRT